MTHVKDKGLRLFGYNKLLLGLREETVLASNVAHDRKMFGHLDRLAIQLIFDVRHIRVEQACTMIE